jgi:predicted small secreted protein
MNAMARRLLNVVGRIGYINLGEGDAMTTKIVLLLAAIMFGASSLTACNTVQGAGRDVEKAGQKVQEEAQEHKKY